MTELLATALTMVDSSTEDVRSAIVDYQDRRQLLLPDECEAYEVVTEDEGVGAEVAMTLALGLVIRNRKGGRRKNRRAKDKQEPLRCVFRLEELTDERIVERDTHSSLCTTWTLRSTGDDRTAVHVEVSWDAPDGFGNFLRRQNEKLAMRMLYEDILTKLHDLFEVDESTARDSPSEDAESQDPESPDAPSEDSTSQDSPSQDSESQDSESQGSESQDTDTDERGRDAPEAGRAQIDPPAAPTAPTAEATAHRDGASPGQS